MEMDFSILGWIISCSYLSAHEGTNIWESYEVISPVIEQ
jgi:hypothetical protein